MGTVFKFSVDIELADVQQTVGALTEKLAWIKETVPYAFREISDIETALAVLNDLENDVANMEDQF